jgi:hypothetical protein
MNFAAAQIEQTMIAPVSLAGPNEPLITLSISEALELSDISISARQAAKRDWAKALLMAAEQGHTISSIANNMNCSQATIFVWTNERRIKNGQPALANRPGNPKLYAAPKI